MKYVHSHWQNLNECKKCGAVCGPAWNGRAWRHIYDGVDAQGEPVGKEKVQHVEWSVFNNRKQFRLSLSVGGGDNADEIMLSIHIPFLFYLYVGFEGYIESRYTKKWQQMERETSVGLDLSGDTGAWGTFVWRFWNDPNEWHAGTPWWRYAYIDIADRLLGPTKYTSEVVEETGAIIHFPEADYPVTVKEEFATWTRPTFFGFRLPFKPFTLKRRSFEITPEKPVPIPGKGENSWDCGDDAVYSMTVRVDSADAALRRFIQSVERTRSKYGWKDPVAP